MFWSWNGRAPWALAVAAALLLSLVIGVDDDGPYKPEWYRY